MSSSSSYQFSIVVTIILIWVWMFLCVFVIVIRVCFRYTAQTTIQLKIFFVVSPLFIFPMIQRMMMTMNIDMICYYYWFINNNSIRFRFCHIFFMRKKNSFSISLARLLIAFVTTIYCGRHTHIIIFCQSKNSLLTKWWINRSFFLICSKIHHRWYR